MLLSRPPRLPLLRRQLHAKTSTRDSSIFKGWKGSSPDENAVSRAEKGDKDDPQSQAAASGLKEREENEGIADNTKSHGRTERGGRKQGRKAKAEHPNAPEPIIGMNDERAEVRLRTGNTLDSELTVISRRESEHQKERSFAFCHACSLSPLFHMETVHK